MMEASTYSIKSFDAAPKTKASEPLENHGKSIVARNTQVDAVPCGLEGWREKPSHGGGGFTEAEFLAQY